jgi:hypothetical protein
MRAKAVTPIASRQCRPSVHDPPSPKDFREAINANTTPAPSRSGLASSMNFLRLGAGYLRISVMIVNLRDDFSRQNG